jgi:hypothetical protein
MTILSLKMATLASRNMQLCLTFKDKVVFRLEQYYSCNNANAMRINHFKNVRRSFPTVPVLYNTVVIIRTPLLNIKRFRILPIECAYVF